MNGRLGPGLLGQTVTSLMDPTCQDVCWASKSEWPSPSSALSLIVEQKEGKEQEQAATVDFPPACALWKHWGPKQGDLFHVSSSSASDKEQLVAGMFSGNGVM